MIQPFFEGYESRSPANDEVLAQYPFISQDDLEQAIANTHKGFAYLSNCGLKDRVELLSALAKQIRANADDLSRTITLEMGKPISQAKLELEKCAAMCEYHGEHAEDMLASHTTEFGSTIYETHYLPLGPVLFISTWNNPLLQATLAFVPQCVAGNSVLVKPAPNAPQCVMKLAALINTICPGQPIYEPILTSIPQTESVLKRRDIRGVTFIGSTAAGRKVASLSAENFKASVIDAGGSDPFIVLGDADLDAAAQCAVKGRFSNTGQSCVAAKRIIVEDMVHDEFVEKLCALTKELKLGDPIMTDTDVGPLAATRFRDEIQEHLAESIKMGATVILGGSAPDGPGAFLSPTVVTDVNTEMPLATEEIFGPVASVFRATDAENAIALANATHYGLGASLFTKNNRHLSAKIHTGNVAINTTVSTAFPVPFGGIKDSGFGVYFGKEGVRCFTNQQIVSRPDSEQ